MGLYLGGGSFSGVNTAGKCWADIMAATGSRPKIKRITLAMPVACSTVPSFQLRRITAAGTTPVGTVTPQAMDGNDQAAVSVIHTGGYSVDPTMTAAPMDVASFPLTAGAAWVWNFGEPGLLIPSGAANGLAIFNVNASGATTGTFLVSVLHDE